MKTIRRLWVGLTTCRPPSDHPNSYRHWYCQKPRWHAQRPPEESDQ